MSKLGFVFCVYMAYLGFGMAWQEYVTGQITAAMQAPEWIFGIMLPIGFIFIAIRFGMEVIWNLKHEEAGEYE